MNFAQIEKTINMLGKKANDGSLSIDEMAGGTFTISNGGTYGSLISTPIINPPQVSQISLLRFPLHSSAVIISWQANNVWYVLHT
jgi:pyruvate/2-oxoglutarate dehydrogenase complex dihydrolipoamide acyltransferase (E2) component